MRAKIILASLCVVAAPAWAQGQQILHFDSSPQTRASTFSGNETRVAALNYVLSDCSSGPRPDIKILRSPANGDLRFVPITIPLARRATDPLAKCNGKIVNALGVFYKSKEGFTGDDAFLIDADYKLGQVYRHSYIVSVR